MRIGMPRNGTPWKRLSQAEEEALLQEAAAEVDEGNNPPAMNPPRREQPRENVIVGESVEEQIDRRVAAHGDEMQAMLDKAKEDVAKIRRTDEEIDHDLERMGF